MNWKQVVEDTNYSVRTQISLSPALYKLMKKWAHKERKSLAAVVRDLALEKAKKEKVADENRTKRVGELIRRTRGTIKPGDGGWGDVKDPHKLIRKWRKEEDKALSKRFGWDE